ncbi:hypothetical protein HMPREF1985_01073 [Mitsuokella sp. oral taxon 131 str. W9106]|nr:hypothetical protein HMPREF1985_01073 [Mitsuokella sp. oral taxon 131 str. W9106]
MRRSGTEPTETATAYFLRKSLLRQGFFFMRRIFYMEYSP